MKHNYRAQRIDTITFYDLWRFSRKINRHSRIIKRLLTRARSRKFLPLRKIYILHSIGTRRDESVIAERCNRALMMRCAFTVSLYVRFERKLPRIGASRSFCRAPVISACEHNMGTSRSTFLLFYNTDRLIDYACKEFIRYRINLIDSLAWLIRCEPLKIYMSIRVTCWFENR